MIALIARAFGLYALYRALRGRPIPGLPRLRPIVVGYVSEFAEYPAHPRDRYGRWV